MAAFRVSVALVVALAAPAQAERRRNALANGICAYVLMLTERAQLEVQPFAAASLGGGLDGYGGGGFAARYHVDDDWVAVIDVSRVWARRQLAMPIAVEQPIRGGAAAFAIGGIPFRGKLLVLDDSLVRFDVISSLGVGVGFFDDRRTAGFDNELLVTAELTLRARPLRWLSIDLAIHDDMLPLGVDVPVAARTITPSATLPPETHVFTVRLGLGFWVPSERGRRCVRRCS